MIVSAMPQQNQLSRLHIARSHKASCASGMASSFFPRVPQSLITKHSMPFTSTFSKRVHTSVVELITEYSSESFRCLFGGIVRQVAQWVFHLPRTDFLKRMPVVLSDSDLQFPMFIQQARMSLACMRLINHQLPYSESTPKQTGLLQFGELQICRVLISMNSLRMQSLTLQTSARGIFSISEQLSLPSLRLMPGLFGLLAIKPLKMMAAGLLGTNLYWIGMQTQSSSFISIDVPGPWCTACTKLYWLWWQVLMSFLD